MAHRRQGNPNKRKRQDPGTGTRSENLGVAQVAHEMKRARMSNGSEEGNASRPSTNKENPHPSQSGEWETVVSKKTKRNHKSEHGHHQENDAGDAPRLRIHQNYKSDIRIHDLRDLALYVLTDSVAPNWLAVRNARKIRKAVVMMLPGLDQEMMEKAQRLLQQQHDEPQGLTGNKAEKSLKPELQDSSGKAEADAQVEETNRIESTDAVTDKMKSALDLDLTKKWLFDKIMEVRAPGDSKQSRVHSPLQAMLISQDPDVKQNSQTSNEKSFKATRTPIAQFIHTADELREAEYPIHPSSFTSAADADLEADRRQRTNQTAASGWVDTKVTTSAPVFPSASISHPDYSITQNLSIYALDCEMVMTSDDVSSLARISVVSYPEGKVMLDKYVKPSLPITNYFTQYSGITPSHLENVTTTLQDIQSELLDLFTPSTVIIGHSLESDLAALKLTHPFIVDTSMLYPHPRGLPLRSSLKFLANKYLRREIQMGGSSGHDSVEDARAVLDLVKLKCEKGPKFGTTEANGEPIFKRLKRSGRTSAIVEYGNAPERGLGKDATFAIGCQNDDEIVAGMLRAIKGDDFFDFQIPKGGVDFVWGRLRALEFERGWVTTATNTEPTQNKDDNSETSPSSLDSTLLQTVSRISEIHSALPSDALLILYSGTSDMRPLMRLQGLQQQYRKEFKVKKWDELSVKWTDTEEQELKRAAQSARRGWGLVCLKE